MDYEKKYKEALDRARKLYDKWIDEDGKDVAFMIFPELKESEDEKIRKAMIHFFSNTENTSFEYWEGIPKSKVIAWIEKQREQKSIDNLTQQEAMDIAVAKCFEQGEQKPADKVEPKFKVGDKIIRKELGGDFIHNPHIIIQVDMLDKKYRLKDGLVAHFSEEDDWKLVEQKPVDKIEPKFKIGDWVVSPNGVYWHIDKISNNRYEVTSNTGESSNWPLDTNIYRSFSIKDAKAGDVLMGNAPFIFNGNLEGGVGCPGAYCGINTLGNFEIPEHQKHWTGHNTQPATKEQRDALMKAMTDAGYTFDFEKMVLKKIEQKPAWSEEDEENLTNCIEAINLNYKWDNMVEWLKSLKDRVQPQPKQEWSQNDIDMIDWLIRCCEKEHEELCNDKYGHQDIVSDLKRDCRKKWNWLESLRNKVVHQNTWKPSDAQMECLLSEVTAWTKGCPKQKILGSLYNDLKKLRGE